MTSRALPLLLALAGVLLAAAAQAQMPLPPSIAAEQAGERAPAKKPSAKPRPKLAPKPANPAERSATAKPAAKPAAAQPLRPETLPLSRKIDRDEIADPHGGGASAGSRMRPMMTPSGRPGMGGSF